jgi:hypothetical protein
MKLFNSLFVLLAVFALAACGTDSNNNSVPGQSAPTPIGLLQVLHASPDAPAVNVLIDGAEVFSGVDYKTASAERFLIAGTHSVQVDAILPGGGTTPVFGPADVDFAADTITTISAVGPVSIPLDVSVETKPDTEAAGAARIFVLHATSGLSLDPDLEVLTEALPVDVYVDAYSEPNAAVGASAPFTFAFKETLGPLELAPGDYQIRVTLSGSLDPVYDSGKVSLAAGDDLTLAAVPNVSGGPAAVTLLALGADGSGDILDVNTPTGLRVGHLSPDTDPVDIVVNGGVYLDNVPYPAVTGIAPLPADTYAVSITTADGGAVAFGPADLTLEAGTWYTVLATDVNANLTVDILTDDARPVALYGKVRIYHASPTAQNVDIYVTGPEDDINDIDMPTLPNVPFGANTGYIPLDEGEYKVTVAPAGTKTEAIVAMVPVSAGSVYTAIAIDDPDTGGFDAILLEDVLDVAVDD